MIATLHADDLEARLSREQNRRIELDADRDAEKLACAYVRRTLEFAGVSLRCLGMKVSVHFAEVYLEGKAPKPPARVRNRILIEELSDQRNDLELKRDGVWAGPRIQFNTSETERELRWESPI